MVAFFTLRDRELEYDLQSSTILLGKERHSMPGLNTVYGDVGIVFLPNYLLRSRGNYPFTVSCLAFMFYQFIYSTVIEVTGSTASYRTPESSTKNIGPHFAPQLNFEALYTRAGRLYGQLSLLKIKFRGLFTAGAQYCCAATIYTMIALSLGDALCITCSIFLE